MKTKIFLLSALFLMHVAGMSATVLKGTVLLNGEEIKADYVKLTNNTVALGTGINACIPQYSVGRVCVPDEVAISGTTYRVTEINSMAFRLCNSITFVEMRGNVKRIGDFAFVGCSSLREVILPATLESIGTGAFIDLPLVSIIIGAETPPVWEYNDVFHFKEGGIGDTNEPQYVGSGVRITVPQDAVDDYQHALYSNTGIGWVTPDGWGYFTAYNDEYKKNYRIYTPHDLESLRILTDSSFDGQVMKRISLEADIDMSDRPVWEHGISNYAGATFTGVFEGHNHTIKGLRVINPNIIGYVGLFTSFDGDTIRNLRLKNCQFQGPSDVGAVYGIQFEKRKVVMENVYADEDVRVIGGNSVGGLVGGVRLKEVNMRNCVFAGGVGHLPDLEDTSQSYVGGLIGETTLGTIKNCAVTGTVNAYEGQGGPFVGKTYYNQSNPVLVDSSYCASSGFRDYSPSTSNPHHNVRLGSHVVIANRDGYDFYQAGSVYHHTFGESYATNIDNMQTFMMVPNLGLKTWVYKFGKYPLPACMEELWPVEKNVFTLRPADMPKERVNALVYEDEVVDRAFRTYDDMTEEVPAFQYGNFTASRLWFDEEINPNVMDRPRILPLGLANITATDGVEYDRELKAADKGPNIIYQEQIQVDENGFAVLDENGDVIPTGTTVPVEQGRLFQSVGYSIYLPYNVTLSPFCKLYQPVGAVADGGTTIVQFHQVEGNEVLAFQPYYVVVEEDTINLSTEEEVFCPRETIGETDINGWKFVGTEKKLSAFEAYNMSAYILQSDGKWHRASGQDPAAYIPAFRAFFCPLYGTDVKSLSMTFVDDDDPTGVVQIQTTDLDGTERYYDLSGRPLPGRPDHGIYIKNGRKYRAD